MEIGNASKDPPARCEARLAIRLENIRLYSAVICTHKTTQSGHTAHCAATRLLNSHASGRTFRLHSASSINPEDGTIRRTYDPRYQIILAVRTKKWENGFLNKSRLLLF